ncbi:hypothetical protein MVEN_00967500 [Mycena venus]|uniref:Uncharacterized protein n=1 Tax=Mycena venus TaxID=2733690 RepID=A0A8H7D1V0_9AGAR|nr:hypothetical protein MVEN_00967500 [Mycena venus]
MRRKLDTYHTRLDAARSKEKFFAAEISIYQDASILLTNFLVADAHPGCLTQQKLVLHFLSMHISRMISPLLVRGNIDTLFSPSSVYVRRYKFLTLKIKQLWLYVYK